MGCTMFFISRHWQVTYSLDEVTSLKIGKGGAINMLIGYQSGGGGYSHVKAYGDVPPKWVNFSAKILRHGSHFGQKNP